MNQPKLLRITTIPASLNGLLKGQLKFLKQRFNVIGVASDGIEVKEIEDREGIEMRCVPMEREIALWKDLISLQALIKLFRKEKPEIVHANTPKASLLSMMAARLSGVPIRIYTVTGLRFEGFDPSLKKRVLIMMERITCSFATHVIPEGNGVKQTLIKNGITRKPLEVIANGNINGVDTKYYSRGHFTSAALDTLRKELGINSGDFVFCCAGRLVIDKGIIELITAFNKMVNEYPNAKLLLLGPFEEMGNALPAQIRATIDNDNHIIAPGFVKDIRPYFELSDIFVFPSYREGFPNVVLQAGALELPCIVTNINGSNEIIEEGKNGMIIPVKNADKLYDSMVSTINNPKLVQSMKDNCRNMIVDRFEQRFVWDALLKRYNEYICEMKIGGK
jgi:glycosyltransferase involved in cell wall biosynthesis